MKFAPRGDLPWQHPSAGDIARYNHRDGNDDYTQAGDLYRLQPEDAKERLIANLAGSLRLVPQRIQTLQVAHFTNADTDLGKRLQNSLSPAPAIEPTPELVSAKA